MSLVSSLSQWTGIDLAHSPCGRQLDFQGKCVNFYEAESSLISVKVARVLSGIGFLAVDLGVMGGMGLGVRKFYRLLAALPSHLPAKVLMLGGVIVMAAVPAIVIAVQLVLGLEFRNERRLWKQEQKLVDALGGKEAYAKLPRIDIAKINEVHTDHGTSVEVYMLENGQKAHKGYWDRIKPEDVNSQPISVGIDSVNRPLVVVCVKEKNSSTPDATPVIAQTFFLRHNNAEAYNGWPNAGMSEHVFPDTDDFEAGVTVVRQLKEKTHPRFELV